MQSILNTTVSCFANYLTVENPAEVNLLQWISSDKYRAQVEQIRELESKQERDKVKATLPAITPSGTFSQRAENYLLRHSGFLQFDIDWKENTHLTNYQDLKRQICHIPNVAYCGLSVSGTGFWGLVPIAFPERHRQHFESLEKAFAHFGIAIDQKPKNVSSLRGYSFDPEPYFNHQAAVYKVYEQPETRKRTVSSTSESTGYEQRKVEACLLEIEKHRADLTGSYQAWFEIGCSLANAFGENGRDYFHRVSQYHPHYSVAKADRQYQDCLKGRYQFTIATFFEYCAQSQIRYKELVSAPVLPVERKPPPVAPAPQQASIPELLKPLQEVPPELPSVEFSCLEKREEKATIYQMSKPETWNLEELENFFAETVLPTEPIQLHPWERVHDPALFVATHLSYLRANNYKRSVSPHLERLQWLKTILVEARAELNPPAPALTQAA